MFSPRSRPRIQYATFNRFPEAFVVAAVVDGARLTLQLLARITYRDVEVGPLEHHHIAGAGHALHFGCGLPDLIDRHVRPSRAIKKSAASGPAVPAT
jgi:hypothetical protein